MFSRILTQTSTAPYSDQLAKMQQVLEQADAIMIGAGSGLSASAGLTYSGERFEKHFGGFI